MVRKGLSLRSGTRRPQLCYIFRLFRKLQMSQAKRHLFELLTLGTNRDKQMLIINALRLGQSPIRLGFNDKC